VLNIVLYLDVIQTGQAGPNTISALNNGVQTARATWLDAAKVQHFTFCVLHVAQQNSKSQDMTIWVGFGMQLAKTAT